MALLAPTESDKRCALADWLELTALFSPRKIASRGDLSNVFDIANDGRADRHARDPVTGEFLDQEILEEPRGELFARTFSELKFRAESLGESYPFAIDSHRMTVRAIYPKRRLHFGQLAYTFCLLVTAIREKMLTPGEELADEVLALPAHFQVCACLAAGGYFGGAVCSFGFPRATGNAFLPALRDAYARFGHGDVRTSILPGQPAATKDGGIDIIAWRDHPDRLPGKLYSLGQCASGKNWKGKPVEIMPFHTEWFSNVPAVNCLPSLYIPFLVYDDLEEYDDDTYAEARARQVGLHERRFGVIFDRLRIAHHVDTCMREPASRLSNVDGISAVPLVADWCNRTVGKVMALEAAA